MLHSGDPSCFWIARHEGLLHRSKIKSKNGNNMGPVSRPVIKNGGIASSTKVMGAKDEHC